MSIADSTATVARRGFTSPLYKILKGLIAGLFSIAITMVGLLFVTFIIARVMPVDPVLAVVGERASQEIYEAAYKAMGLDQPLYVQFMLFLKQVAMGDFGMSTLTARPVVEDIARVFPATLELATLATIAGVGIGVPMGVLAAVNEGRWPDQLIRLVGLFGYSMPIFWFGLMGLLIFYGILGWVSGPGRIDIYYEDIVPVVSGMILIDSLIAGEIEIFWNAVSHIILPASILGYYSIAYISRMTRSFMLEQFSQEYITTARVKGVSETAVIWRHALPNVMIPLITVIALSYANLLEGSVLTEIIFSWPGLGNYITNALLSADMNAVLGGTVVVGAIFVGLNLFSDFMYKVVDPRAR
ncbi:putative D,D-dipeptide transport system permease protein DdpB [Pseudovibrio sp. W64]|uniref:ABC transporter permease n=1 Tax=unclassified Pseudovibrio TaxID=2627060 RepID=UPI0007AE95A6|nr:MULTISPECIES: ABC transporter permease [unclassified Pseudovibrio]KZK77271.1 putative D,D-dipeptide transport system permease protein DdpB [Pseudovibrio sp. Ad46]KZK86724.1 putative D,D-dipeptide transport system permease protein DdpB [Pseudovibrio sp. W64]KZL03030.1 putative D,D-dipeptide transport system permease protein DdpB [Pseudovibrio sp. W74]KZL04951.1 putative D,D-dipeptide transport system permease protein DdpB [Pseudovibrio sp. Ad14]KZL14425.1 putative D,D-dipeptide transport sys